MSIQQALAARTQQVLTERGFVAERDGATVAFSTEDTASPILTAQILGIGRAFVPQIGSITFMHVDDLVDDLTAYYTDTPECNTDECPDYQSGACNHNSNGSTCDGPSII